MKKLTFILFLTCSVLFGQEAITKKLGDFSTLKIYSGLTVEIQKANTSEVVITGKKADQVSIKNKNGVLKISLGFPDGFKYEDVKVMLYYSDDIAILDANEGSYIISGERISQQHLELKTQEGANIDLVLDVKYLTIKSVSGGIIETLGTTQNQTIEANTGGIYKGFELKSVQTTASSSSGAVVDVNVSEMLDAKVNFGGSIYYIGNPEELKTKKMIGGVIKAKKL